MLKVSEISSDEAVLCGGNAAVAVVEGSFVVLFQDAFQGWLGLDSQRLATHGLVKVQLDIL